MDIFLSILMNQNILKSIVENEYFNFSESQHTFIIFSLQIKNVFLINDFD